MVSSVDYLRIDNTRLNVTKVVGRIRGAWGLFLERPGNLTGPISYFEIKFSRRVGCVLTSNVVQFVSLADNFTAQFSNPLKLSSGMENKTP